MLRNDQLVIACLFIAITPSYLFSDDQLPQQANEYFRARKEQYSKLKGKKPPFKKFVPETDPEAMHVGQVGRFPEKFDYECLQVVDNVTCIVTPTNMDNSRSVEIRYIR